MTGLAAILAGLCLVAGSVFAMLGGLGVLRLPDLYSRSHAASKVGSVGAGLMLLALAIRAPEAPETLRALMAILFFLLTAPIAAHLLARAAYSAGYPLGPAAVRDELAAETDRLADLRGRDGAGNGRDAA